MGLDTIATLQIFNKKEMIPFAEIDVAYWRKYWSLDNELRWNARKSEYWLGEDSGERANDYMTTCSPNVLDCWINYIISILKDIEANEWTNCLWDAIEAREYTCSQLARLLTTQTITQLGFNEYSLELYNDQARESARLDYKDEEAYTLKEPELKKILDNYEDYEWRIIFISSY